MSEHSIYRDIAVRGGGDIYIGVVGPVRTGKSTFIKRFMDSVVLPNIENEFDRNRARDEMPQSASGKTVMTTEPKFVPDEAVSVRFEDGASLKVKMIDCVGYIVPDAIGHIEDGKQRMVSTPWSDKPIPFTEAAEIGTEKVIREHSTIGMVVTTDGTIGEIPRESYVSAEERVVKELKELGKPFAIILNSAEPETQRSTELAYELEEKYGVPVALVNCLDLDSSDIKHILRLVLAEFPVERVDISLPRWLFSLEENHTVRTSICGKIAECAAKVKKIGDVQNAFAGLGECEHIESVSGIEVDYGKGNATAEVKLPESLYYSVLSELTGFDIGGEDDLINLMRELAHVKGEYDKISEALDAVHDKGYGIVMPSVEDLRLEEPEIVKQAGGYGVRLRAAAQSIHMIRANIETEISPIVGTEAQSEELVRYMLKEFEEDPKAIWESNMFGKSLYALVNEGLHTKLAHMPDDARVKLSGTLERIINEGSGGLICIIL
ncbi:MAG: stage IV sporulation protein A [Ruminococcaceae bacterium]|nr:stage IV sporulation protein A [Oscillospiraceae bacterium]